MSNKNNYNTPIDYMSCARDGCIYMRGNGIANSDAAYCCFTCKNNGEHWKFCERRKMPSTDILHQSKHIIVETTVDTPISAHVAPALSSSYFYADQLATIYQFPHPSDTPITIAVISFGGGLFGNLDANGVLTGGDVQAYWSSRGITPANQPKVIVNLLDGATNNTADLNPTFENTLDVETIGACYPSSKLTIILYIGPNTFSEFPKIMRAATSPTSVNGTSYGTPKIVSISWGAPEIYYSSAQLNEINAIMQAATNKGINICVATGDNGSNDGVGGSSSYADFPSSSPYCTAVGGTRLVCPTTTYGGAGTTESAWTSGGGAISGYFPKPAYQQNIVATGRSTPDIASDADPKTGVIFLVNGKNYVFGGTSVAAPTVAAFLAAANVSSFLNPILYTAQANCFNDILLGNNGQYVAKAGYDNCTGWGTIKGSILKNIFGGQNLISGITIPSSQTLNISQTYTVSPIITPANATNKLLAWSSSDPTKVTVSSAGVVTGIAATIPGLSVTIRCSSIDGSNKTSSMAVIVNPQKVTGLGILGLTAVKVGKTIQLNATVQAVNTSNKTVAWSSSAPAKATVNSSGLVTGVASGTSIITCSSTDGSNISTTKTITVTA
jgi:subtilase family serine protease